MGYKISRTEIEASKESLRRVYIQDMQHCNRTDGLNTEIFVGAGKEGTVVLCMFPPL